MSTSSQPTKKKTRRTPPARSAKILVFGLSSTAMLGMSSGYAFADLAQKNEDTNGTPVQTLPTATQAVTAQSQMPITPVEANTPAATPVVDTPQQSTVIEVPVPSSGATPGSGNSSWKKQKSSGSN